MAILSQSSAFNHLHELLCSLYKADDCDYAYDWAEYPVIENELIDTLASDVDNAGRFINSLDFNDKVDAHIINFIPKIIEKLKTFGERLAFMDYINAIQKNYPHLNLGELSFNMILSMGSLLNDSL